ncbi:MAG: AraC family transcriptional regulator [Acidobacteriota bacterium]
MSVTGKALWFIESHLGDDLPLDRIADAVGVSPFHLCRAFPVTTARSVAAYVRARRLSEAARALAAGAPDILTVALDAGYGSHEAFTRAFRQQFETTPEDVRTQATTHHLPLQEPLRMNPTTSHAIARPSIRTREAFLVFGLSQHYQAGGNAGIPSQWNRFGPHIGHITNEVPGVSYGVVHNVDATNNFDYLCGVEVTEFPAEPSEFARLRVPAGTYAVFEHGDHISSIQATFTAIWERGLKEAGVKAADAPMFERYDDRFDARTGLGGLEIWVPIQA